MPLRLLFLALVAVFPASFAGCGSGSAPQPPTAPSQSASWTLTFNLSGGFAGVDRQLDLSSSGAATASDRRRHLTRTAQLSGDELTAIASLVSTARSVDLRSTGCADCFEYDLDLQASSGRISIRANDAGLQGDDPAPLVRSLGELLNRLLSVSQP